MRLFTPGPVQIPSFVLEAFCEPSIHHRSLQFKSLFKETQRLYQEFISCSELPVFLASSGTGGMEAALINSVSRDDLVLSINLGKFGERWAYICKAFNLPYVEIKKELGEAITPLELINKCRELSPSVIALQHCETSTGVLLDLKQYTIPLKEEFKDLMIIVDAISTGGVEIINQEELKIDILICASQKGFMLPPGLSILSFSKDAKEKILSNKDVSSFYFSLKTEINMQEKGGSAWTTATHHIKALNVLLKYLLNKGIRKVHSEVAEKALYFREEIFKRGFLSFPKPPYIANSVAALLPPKNILAEELREKLLSRYGYLIAGGQAELKGKIVRVSFMGDNSLEEFSSLLKAIDNCIN